MRAMDAGELLGAPGLGLAPLTAPLPRGDDADQESQPQRWDRGALLPVLVVLRDLASQLPPPGAPVAARTLWGFIRGRLKQSALDDYAPHLKRHLLDKGSLILLDGLDEVPDGGGRRVQIKQAVQDFVATFSRCRFLVTSRTYAYQRQDWKLDGFSEAHLLPFTTEQIGRFVKAWYGHMVELERLGESDANDRAAVLIRAVEHNERLRELDERPLLLTLIAKLQTEGGGALPEKREALYDKAVEMLLTQWERMKIRVRDDGTKVVEPSLAEWLNAERDAILPATERALPGRSLAVLGDPRPEVMTLDGMQFFLVPPGAFIMGEDDSAFTEEQPQHRVDLPYPYLIGRFPITVAQWREYLRIGGGVTADDVGLRGRDNDPVVAVSWHDAMRFCDVITAAWRERLPEGFIVTLPSEAEWEKAARGGEQVVADHRPLPLDRLISQLPERLAWPQRQNPDQARVYPWGDDFDAEMANVESAIGETSAVGCYRMGCGPYGCEELSGNVWEWTRSLWGKDFMTPHFRYPYDPADSTREALDASGEILRTCGSCAAARGAAIGTSRAAPIAPGILPSTGSATWAFGWCCAPPLFPDSGL